MTWGMGGAGQSFSFPSKVLRGPVTHSYMTSALEQRLKVQESRGGGRPSSAGSWLCAHTMDSLDGCFARCEPRSERSAEPSLCDLGRTRTTL